MVVAENEEESPGNLCVEFGLKKDGAVTISTRRATAALADIHG
jgi:hypothetical protein